VQRARTAALNAPLVIPAIAARLTMINESDCEWLITVSPFDGGEGEQWKLQVGKTREVALAEGQYRVEQKMLSVNSAAAPVRWFTFKLEAKQNYRWRLVNLLSSDAAELRVPLEKEDGK